MTEYTKLIELVVNESTRAIAIPNGEIILGVAGDINVNRVKFKMVRYYCGYDMAKFIPRINYVNPNGDANYYESNTPEVIEENIVFEWCLTPDVTKYGGNVKFSIKLYRKDGDTVAQSLNSRPANGKVQDGYDVENYVTPEEQQSLLDKLEAELRHGLDTFLDEKKAELTQFSNDTLESVNSEINTTKTQVLSDINVQVSIAEEKANNSANSASDAASSAQSSADNAKASSDSAAKAIDASKTAQSSASSAASASQKSSVSETNAKASETDAAKSASSATESATRAETAATKAEQASSTATTQATAASKSSAQAAESAKNASASASTASTAKDTAVEAKTQATTSASEALKSANAAKTSETASAGSAKSAEDASNSIKENVDQITKNTVAINLLMEKMEEKITNLDILFKLPRTGKVYTVKIPKFATNQTTVCEKMGDNKDLVCEPSTDTVEGRDDYADIPLFKWYRCNYLRDETGHAYPTAIEGLNDEFTTSGNVDVGIIQMTPFVKWDDSNEGYDLLSITDSPKDGFTPWVLARAEDTTYPYVIHSAYFSGLSDDGLLRSKPGLKPERSQSYLNEINNYLKKGIGYFGAGNERNVWQIIFTLIKYANKSSQNVFQGTVNNSFQYKASIKRSEKLTYFPVTKAQAANIVVGSYVSVGYGAISNGIITLDRGNTTVHKYADDVKVLRIEELDDSNSAVYLDVVTGFDTVPVALSDTLTGEITLTSMHWWSGSTDSVIGHHDGSLGSNADGKHPYRVQGVEYAVGGYFVASDVVYIFDDQNGKDVYVCPHGTKRSNSDVTILSTYQKVGNIASGDFWIGDIGFDVETCITWSKTKGSSNATGVGDMQYGGGNAARNATRECLLGGYLSSGSSAGSSYSNCWSGLGSAYWNFLSAD